MQLQKSRFKYTHRTDSTDFTNGPFLLSISVILFLVSSLFFFLFGSVQQIKLATRQLLGACCACYSPSYHMHKFYFANRLVDHWNSPPNWVVTANNIKLFLKRLG